MSSEEAATLAELPLAPYADPLPRDGRDAGVVTHIVSDFRCVQIDQVWQHKETGEFHRVVCCLLEAYGVITLNERKLQAWGMRGFLETHTFIGAATVTLPKLAPAAP